MNQRGAHGRDGWWDVAWWILLAVIALAFAIGIARSVPDAYAAAFGHSDVSGVFVPQRSECRVECTYYGTFDSADGRVRLRLARLDEPFLSLPRGEPVAAVLPRGDSADVFVAHGSRLWLEWSALIALALAVMVIALTRVRLVQAFLAERPSPYSGMSDHTSARFESQNGTRRASQSLRKAPTPLV